MVRQIAVPQRRPEVCQSETVVKPEARHWDEEDVWNPSKAMEMNGSALTVQKPRS
jgi:hypothetical protein